MDLAWVFEKKHYDTPKHNGVLDFGLLSDHNVEGFHPFTMCYRFVLLVCIVATLIFVQTACLFALANRRKRELERLLQRLRLF